MAMVWDIIHFLVGDLFSVASNSLSLSDDCIFGVYNNTTYYLAAFGDESHLYSTYNILFTRIIPVFAVCLLGLTLNVLFMVVVWRVHSLRTTTNMYLYNQAVVDSVFLLLYLMVQMVGPIAVDHIYDMSYLGQGGCTFVNVALDVCLLTSEFNITLFTIERYVAICHPFRALKMESTSRTLKLIFGAWVLGLAFALPMIYFYLEWYTVCLLWPPNPNGTVTDLPDTYTSCWAGVTSTGEAVLYYLLPVIVFFAVFTTIAILNTLTGVELRRMIKRCRLNAGVSKHRTETRLVIMLAVTAAVFFICLFPYHLELIFNFGIAVTDGAERNASYAWTEICRWLPIVNSSINPIIYGY
ncbi:nociceptin receptor-like [Ptychodera flava]|uniref:nociceptin receptor-like n=1 Tax=Ptychodera flava TaxID=63121 RepID=UPI003969C899